MRWLTVVIFYLAFLFCSSRPVSSMSGQAVTGTDYGEVWLATYLAGIKIGYGVLKYNRSNGGFNFDYVTRMTVGMLGKKQTVNVRSQVATDESLALWSFEFRMSSQDGSFTARGRCEDGRFVLETGNGTRVIHLTRKLYPIEALGIIVTRSQPDHGTRLNYLTFDGAVLDTMGTEVEVLGREMFKIGETAIPALKMKVRRAKFDMTVWVDGYGMTLKEDSPMGISSVRVGSEQALAGEAGYPLDLLRIFAVRVDTIIPEGRRWRRMVLTVSGIDTALLPASDENQRIVTVEGGDIRMEIKIPLPDSTVKLPVDTCREFLKPTVTIQSTAPEIVRTARQIVNGTDNAATAVQEITDWVFRSLQKEAVASFPNAVDVLKNMRGDCNEHAVLFAALSRAAGIPAKVSVGLVYLRDGFYYHAWNEVYLGKWVPVDATFGEFPASAVRLKLAEGELSEQAQVLGVVSRIKIRVLEFE
ncbi:MAG: transglutaminase-like domain-containing protein [candidate division WOR-3 bacterium]